MAMADNPVIGHFLACNTSTGWSLPATTSNILPAASCANRLDANKNTDMGKINSVYPTVPKLVGTIDGPSIFYS